MKEKIIENASELFINQGFKVVTMDDIAVHMGISKKTIYQHFENKQMLIDAVLTKLFVDVNVEIEKIEQMPINAIEALVALRNIGIRFTKDQQSPVIMQLIKYYPNSYKRVEEWQTKHLEQFKINNLKRGITEGLYKPDLNTQFIAKMYQAGITAIFHSNAMNFHELNQLHLEYHISAIATPEGIHILHHILNN